MTDKAKPYTYRGPGLKPGDRTTFKIGDQLYADIVTEIKTESPLFQAPQRPSRWRRFLLAATKGAAVRWLPKMPPPPAALPTTTVTTMGDPVEIGSPGWQGKLDAREDALQSCLRALAAIEKIESTNQEES